MKFTLVLTIAFAAMVNVAAQTPADVPPGFVLFENGVETGTSGDVAQPEALESFDGVKTAVEDFQTILTNGVQDFKTILSFVDLVKGISTSGLNADNGAQLLSSIKGAIDTGILRVNQGKDIVKDMQGLVSKGQADGSKAVFDIKDIFQSGMKPATTADLAGGLSTVIKNGGTDIVNGIHLVKLIQAIQRDGLNAENGPQLVKDIETAIKNGIVHVKDGVNLGHVIQDIVKNGMSIADGSIVASAITSAIQSALSVFDPNPQICRRKGEGRGFGKPLQNQCQDGEEAYGALCYPKCKDGYEKVGCCICRKKGCSGVDGAVDIGVSCSKPKPYGRGVGYALWHEGKCKAENANYSCEKNGLMWYPKCKPGFHNVGCCICSPDCPAGTTDDGEFCRKDSYGRGVGASRLGCPAGLDKSGLFCYPACKPHYNGVGPVCWPECPANAPFKCGLFCTSSAAACFSETVEIVGAATQVTLSLISQDFTGAIAGAIREGVKVISLPKCAAPPAV
ncbi:Aste57867_9542 [Aphanomyces stellatus]|uniref:Aste57867_9542 protein n=1 Tax=Aphanomyces stellatus TaxID=120398 RepID=A0A485KN24_9STRA|nr:hypothetical protein As57867_009505 [Aphanomyces stellatus]VFT86421.1 Aste57867_9542 [Aphanomyces stellatus]